MRNSYWDTERILALFLAVLGLFGFGFFLATAAVPPVNEVAVDIVGTKTERVKVFSASLNGTEELDIKRPFTFTEESTARTNLTFTEKEDNAFVKVLRNEEIGLTDIPNAVEVWNKMLNEKTLSSQEKVWMLTEGRTLQENIKYLSRKKVEETL
jgi:hypothetical protein